MPMTISALLLLFVIMSPATVAIENTPTIGPANGWLIINGGGGLPPETKTLFVALAGGRDANFVVIPTAEEDGNIDIEKVQRSSAANFGVTHVTVLHTRDRARANSDGFVEPLRHASGVYIEGGANGGLPTLTWALQSNGKSKP